MGLFGWRRARREGEPSKLEYLNRYTLGLGRIAFIEAPVPQDAAIPRTWRTLPELEPKDRAELMVDLMRRVVGEQLPRTLSYLDEHCTNAELAQWGERYVVIYTVMTNRGNPLYYCGGNPLQPTWPDAADPARRNVREVWDQIPDPLKSFYETVHDGFYYFACGALGLSQLSDVTCLGDEDLEPQWRSRFAGSYMFYSHLTGGYLVLDVNGPRPGRADMWWNDPEPELDIDFWRQLDELTAAGFNPIDA